MTRIWWILIPALKSPKNLHFDMSFPVMFDLKTPSGVIFHDTRVMQNFKKNWLLLSKMTWGISEIFTRALEKLKIGTLMGFFCPKLKMHELKIYWGVMWHENEEWCKNWREIDYSVQNWHEQFDKFWLKHSKISKICNLMGFFWTKYIMLELKKV